MEFTEKSVYGIERKICLWNLKKNQFMELGPRIGAMNWGHELGPRIGTMNWGHELGPRIGATNWGHKLGRQIGATNWGHELGPQICLWNLKKNPFMEFKEKSVYGI